MMTMFRTFITLLILLLVSDQAFSAVKSKKKKLDIDVYRTKKELSETPVTKAMQPQNGTLSCGFDQNSLPAVISLTEVIERTLCNNPQSKQAWAMAKSQAAQVGIAKASYLPTVTASYNYGEGNSDYQVKNYPNLSYDTDIKSRGLSFDASWLLFDFGTRKSKVDQAKFLLSAAYANQNMVLQQVFLNAAQAYYELVRIQGVVAANIEAEKKARQSALAAQARYKAGVGMLSDQLQAQTSQAKAISERIRSQGDLQAAKGELASMMGAPVNATYKLEEPTKPKPLRDFSASIEDLLAQATQSHPELMAAKAQVNAAQVSLKSLKREGLPTISLTSSMNDGQQQGTPPADTKTNSLYWGVKLSVPLFEGFGRHYRVKAAEAELESKYADLAQTQQQVTLKVWKSYYALTTETENMKAIDLMQKSASQSYQVSLGRYKAGVGSMLELVSAQNALVDAQQQKNAAVAAWQTARIQLFASLGQLGLWDLN